MTRRLESFVNALVAGRRPRRFTASDDEGRVMATAAALRAARDDVQSPDPAFVDDLARRMRRAAAESSLSPRGQARRRFLAASGIAAAAAVTGVAADRFLGGRQYREQETLTPGNGRWQVVAQVASIPASGIVRFSVSGVTGFVIRSAAGVTALSAVCTHMGCILDADPAGQRLRCPCHDTSFSTTGEAASDYPLSPLPRLLVRINGEHVEVMLPAPS